MILLTVQSLSKHFGPEPVLADVSFDLRPGEQIGLVGPNGTGKTTLLQILAGLQDADGGQIERHPSLRCGYLEQHPQFEASQTVWSEAEAGLSHLVALQAEAEQLAEAIARGAAGDEQAKLAGRFDQVQHQLQQQDAYQLDHKIERVLLGLGFDASQFQLPVTKLSGGQQNRLLLARLLLAAPDLLLLDEPSNHLDIEATQWLEEYLVTSRQTLIMVSHDRYLLDKVTNRTLELFRGTIDSYRGNFSAYWRQKAERLEVQRRTFENQQTEIARLEDFVRRHQSGQKHAQAEDRRKKLERIERVEPPREITVPPMGFPKVERAGDVVLRVERLAKAYDQPLFHDLTFDIQRGERWGILGSNGAGKTTLLRCLLDREKPDDGRVILGTGVRIGYFDQMLQEVEEQLEVLEAVRPPGREFNQQQRRDLLARFGITGDMVFQPVHSLSGGERNRLVLARLAAMEANLLILDEPTNHLDLWARDALEQSLRQFQGTVLFVSHDRYFLNRVADHLLVMDSGRVSIVHGNYDSYLQMRQAVPAGESATRSASDGAKQKSASGRETRSNKTRPKRRFPYRKVADIEQDIMTREAKIEQLHETLIQPEVLRDGTRVKQLQAELDQTQQELATLYEHWEEATELNS